MNAGKPKRAHFLLSSTIRSQIDHLRLALEELMLRLQQFQDTILRALEIKKYNIGIILRQFFTL